MAKKNVAHRIILESLLANGPAYKLVAHESDEWRKIEEEPLWCGMIEIISDKEEEKVIEEVNSFFAPCIEGIPYVENKEGRKFTPDLLTNLLRKLLSHILIANQHKAWIYGDDIIEEALDQADGILT